MYLGTDDSFTYTDKGGLQHHTQGDFLILMTPDDKTGIEPSDMRACIRQVALSQVGHYMMGTARIGGETFTVSGAYGSNGLTMSVPRNIWEEYGTPVPEPLYHEWKNGGGHNSAGKEAIPMREWAKDHFDELTPA